MGTIYFELNLIFRIQESFSYLLEYVAKLIEENSAFADLKEQELNHAKQIIENFICKKIYLSY